MTSFVIKRINKKWFIKDMPEFPLGYTYKIKKSKYIEVKEISIIKPEIISALICSSFQKKYQKILETILISDNEDEDSGTELMLALDEVARLKNIIIKKYHKYLKIKQEEKILNTLKALENEIRAKIIDYKIIKEQEQLRAEEKNKSR